MLKNALRPFKGFLASTKMVQTYLKWEFSMLKTLRSCDLRVPRANAALFSL